MGASRFAKGLGSVVVGCLLLGGVALANSDEQRVVRYRVVDREEIENLQRWVAAGHEDWCKDARLVASKELERIAPEFAGNATELFLMESNEGQIKAFEWRAQDGRTYRVTVERFAWLLPIASEADQVVWVPTVTEIWRVEEPKGQGGVSSENQGKSKVDAQFVGAAMRLSRS